MSDQLKTALFVFGGFLLGLMVGNVFRPVPPYEKAWEARIVRYQKDSTAYERMLEAANGERDRAEAKSRESESRRIAAVARADAAAKSRLAAKATADSALARLDSAKTASDSVPVLVAALSARTEEADAATGEAHALRVGILEQIQATGRIMAALKIEKWAHDSTKRRLAIADDMLRDRPRPERCQVLWFKCPSRTTTFVLGAALGVAGAVVVLR